MEEVTEAVIQMVKLGNMLNWNDPIDQDYVNALNGLKALRNAAEQTVVADRATRCACGNMISPSNKCEGCAELV
jgi:hypothetical protein